jgi:hypothetical protein
MCKFVLCYQISSIPSPLIELTNIGGVAERLQRWDRGYGFLAVFSERQAKKRLVANLTRTGGASRMFGQGPLPALNAAMDRLCMAIVERAERAALERFERVLTIDGALPLGGVHELEASTPPRRDREAALDRRRR